MNRKVDLHIHSTYSDGVVKPADLVNMYKKKGYDTIALTDHDGIGGIKEAEAAGRALDIKVIPGIELSTSYIFMRKKLELHILGYHIDTENKELNERLKDIRKMRRERNERLLRRLNRLGYAILYEDLLERPGQDYIGKPNFARAMQRKGYDPGSMWEVFDAENKEKISSEEGITLIKGAGGVAVLAHPFKIKNLAEPGSDEFWGFIEAIIRDLKGKGLEGLECGHPSATPQQSLRLKELAGKYCLRKTEGSDFHG